jgi:hypothetical protein
VLAGTASIGGGFATVPNDTLTISKGSTLTVTASGSGQDIFSLKGAVNVDGEIRGVITGDNAASKFLLAHSNGVGELADQTFGTITIKSDGTNNF